MPVADAQAAPTTLGELDAQLAAFRGEGVPLLVFRLPALERTAWRNGLRAARAIERRAGEAFAAAAAGILRPSDLIAHDRGSDAFVAALVAPTRDGHRSPAPVDIRSALARISATIEGLTALDVDAGWTKYDAQTARIEAAIPLALRRGAQERERYAFFSAIGHELRTPLASIRGYLETLSGGIADAATSERFIRIAHAESLRLTRLLEGMFEISLLDLSAPFARKTHGALDAALAGTADAGAALAAQYGVDLRVAVIPPIVVAIDTDRLMLVLVNLVVNALKHGRRGGRVDVTVDVQTPRTVTIAVDDDGPGIPPPMRERVFALGERGRTASEGSGIGLALVRMILERTGGRVEAGESPRGGARFAVTVPRADSPVQRNDEAALRLMQSMGTETDFRSGRDFPRRARHEIGGFLWLARVFDKARAAQNGTIHDYIYPCPMDRGVFDRWGITSRMFDAALDSCTADDEILTWIRARVTDERRDEANRWLLEERLSSLDRLDAEEGFVVA